MFSPDDVDRHTVSPRNAVEVQVRQLHDLHAVEAGRQTRRRDADPFDVQLERLQEKPFREGGTRECTEYDACRPSCRCSVHISLQWPWLKPVSYTHLTLPTK